MSVFPSQVNFVTGDILTATAVNEIGQAINLLDGAQFAAGKNKIINGDFGVWQRGTSFTPAAANTIVFNSDRFFTQRDGTGATVTTSQQTFTPGTAPVAGYEGQYFLRYAQTVAGTGGTYSTMLGQNIEDVRTFAGQTVTLSFWAKSSTSSTIAMGVNQFFGSGGSSQVNASAGSDQLLTTSWVRYTRTFSVPAITGKTIAASNYLQLYFGQPTANTVATVDFWGVQLENAQTASNFQTATGTKQGELAACQRYYTRFSLDSTFQGYGTGIATTVTNLRCLIPLPVTLRVPATSIDFAGSGTLLASNYVANNSVTNVTLDTGYNSRNAASLNATTTAVVAGSVYVLLANGSGTTTQYLGFSAEL